MAKREVRAVAMVRKIRDELTSELAGKSDEEVIELFRKAGLRAQLRVKRRGARSPKRKRK
jgi:hypothetical protein